MDILELVQESFGTLTRNRMRTGLAVLGIVIGIGSVIALVSMGQASKLSIENSIQSLGSNLLTVMPGAVTSGGVRGAAGGGESLTLADAKAMMNNSSLTLIEGVSPELSRRSQVTAGRNNTNTQIYGVYPQYAEIRNLDLETGSFVSQRDVDGIKKVAVLGSTAAIDLFGDGESSIGQSVRINGQSLKVIGVLNSKGGSGFNNPDDAIYVPLTTAQKSLFGSDYLSSIAVEAKTKEVMVDAQNELGYFLLERHKLDSPEKANFVIMSQSDILSTASTVTSTFTALLGGIAAISLLVGGIGIMNIMLVTVTERTREIGLRKALGAKNKTIVTQFLIEATMLTIAGGLIGIVLGVSASAILAQVMSLPFYISLNSVFSAFAVSGIIGIVFGWYPAKQASRLQPIEALRYE